MSEWDIIWNSRDAQLNKRSFYSSFISGFFLLPISFFVEREKKILKRKREGREEEKGGRNVWESCTTITMPARICLDTRLLKVKSIFSLCVKPFHQSSVYVAYFCWFSCWLFVCKTKENVRTELYREEKNKGKSRNLNKNKRKHTIVNESQTTKICYHFLFCSKVFSCFKTSLSCVTVGVSRFYFAWNFFVVVVLP